MFQKLSTFLEAIKFSHSVFALPFALASMLIAAQGLPSLWQLFFIVLAVVSARTAAMAFNRLVDREFDARNPRTQNRALVTGELSPQFMLGALGISALLFFFSAGMLNRTCLILSPPVLAILLGYSLTKRFTPYSHIVLGVALGLAPIGAWLAIRPEFYWIPITLGIAVVLWVSGFDILYSCQDYRIDKSEKELYSMPKALGIPGAMQRARMIHGAAIIAFLIFWFLAPLGILSLLSIVMIASLIAYQHSIVSPKDLSRIDAAFFTSNGLISLGFLILIAMDVFLG